MLWAQPGSKGVHGLVIHALISVFRRACAQMVIDFNEHVHSFCNSPERATELPVLAF